MHGGGRVETTVEASSVIYPTLPDAAADSALQRQPAMAHRSLPGRLRHTGHRLGHHVSAMIRKHFIG